MSTGMSNKLRLMCPAVRLPCERIVTMMALNESACGTSECHFI